MAQDASSIALDRFEPTAAGDDLFSVPDPTVRHAFRPAAGLVMSYARSPLHLARASSSGSDDLGVVVSHQLTTHMLLSAEMLRAVKADVDMPFTASQSGQSPASLRSPSGAALNDVRLGLRWAGIQQRGALPAAAIGVDVWLPSGSESNFAGAGVVRYGGFVLAGSDFDHVGWRAMIGRRRSDAREGEFGLGSDVVFGSGVVWRSGAWQVGPEVFGSTAVGGGSLAFTARTTGLEAIAGARYRAGPVTVGLAAGPGFFKSAGTPAWRIVVGAQLALEREAAATPTAGQSAGRPATPQDDHSARDGACSVPTPPMTVVLADRDGDGVPDTADACPDRVGERDGPRAGCPADRDEDGAIDVVDACPEQAGGRSADPGKDGCPPDTDGDGITDSEDACPRERGERDPDPAKSGCPTAVRVTGNQIVVTQNVNFARGSADLDAASEPVLMQVAQVLHDHPEIVRIAVDGHTDPRGTDRANLALSRRRAIAVVRWLVSRGVDERRLEARGFGARRPVADNKTPEGQAKNRRVEFLILNRDERGDAAWKDGAAQERP